MPGPLPRDEAIQVARHLRERLSKPVGLDVWTRQESGLLRTDRDVCNHCDDVLALTRQLATLHPALSITPYDLDRHADRAQDAGVEMPPTTIVRGNGRAIHIAGLCSGLLFPALLDLIWFASVGSTPIGDETRSALDALPRATSLEVMVTPYDPYSAHLVRVASALAVESRLVRLRITEIAEFPVLAGQRSVSQVPLLTIDGRRFTGVWEEQPLVEQIRRVLEGNDEPVVRDRILATPFLSEEEARRMAEEHQGRQQSPPSQPPGAPAMPATPPSGPPSSIPSEEPPGSGLVLP